MFKRHLLAVSVHKNKLKWQNTGTPKYCFTGHHLNLDRFLRAEYVKNDDYSN